MQWQLQQQHNNYSQVGYNNPNSKNNIEKLLHLFLYLIYVGNIILCTTTTPSSCTLTLPSNFDQSEIDIGVGAIGDHHGPTTLFSLAPTRCTVSTSDIQHTSVSLSSSSSSSSSTTSLSSQSSALLTLAPALNSTHNSLTTSDFRLTQQPLGSSYGNINGNDHRTTEFNQSIQPTSLSSSNKSQLIYNAISGLAGRILYQQTQQQQTNTSTTPTIHFNNNNNLISTGVGDVTTQTFPTFITADGQQLILNVAATGTTASGEIAQV